MTKRSVSNDVSILEIVMRDKDVVSTLLKSKRLWFFQCKKSGDMYGTDFRFIPKNIIDSYEFKKEYRLEGLPILPIGNDPEDFTFSINTLGAALSSTYIDREGRFYLDNKDSKMIYALFISGVNPVWAPVDRKLRPIPYKLVSDIVGK